MAIAQHLSPAGVLLDPKVRDKWELLARMVRALAEAGALPPDREREALEALEARERSKSTGMDQGVAVPHAALEGLEHLAAGLCILPGGLEFDSLDGRPAQFVVMLVVPKAERITHVRTLAEVARRLGDPAFRSRLLQADDPAQVVDLWDEGSSP